MKASSIHVLHVFANNDGVPYLSWFMERARAQGGVYFSFILLVPQRPKMIEEITSLGFDCTWIKFDDRHRKRSMLRALPLLWWRMVCLRPDVVHGHLFDDTLPAMLAAWLARIKIRMYTRQDTGFHWNYTPKWIFLDRLNAQLATRVIAVSHAAKTHMVEKEGIPERKIGMVHHGIPTDRFTAQNDAVMARLRTRFGLAEAFPVVGTLARFIEWKGYRHIVNAARLIVDRHPSARFLFCGSGPQEQEVRLWVQQAGLCHNVVFTGWVDRADVPSLFGVMDIYLHAADHEPFGFVYAEAMMAGTPIVSTPTGAALDAIEGPESGVLVIDRTGAALAQGMESLLLRDHKAVGQAGRAIALRKFTFDRMWEGYMAEYSRAEQILR